MIKFPDLSVKDNTIRYVNDEIKDWKEYTYPDITNYKYEVQYEKTKGAREAKLMFCETDLVAWTPFIVCGKSSKFDPEYFTIRYGENQKEFSLKASDMGSKALLLKALTSHGIRVNDVDKTIQRSLTYLTKCVFIYGRNLRVTPTITANGWQDGNDLFVMGKIGITKDRIFPVNTVIEETDLVDNFVQAGTKEGWVEAVSPIMTHRIVRFKFYDSMSAGLKKPLNIESHVHEIPGATGTGKTTIEHMINSAVGHPHKLECNASSTKIGITLRVAGQCDIPIDIEEATDSDDRARVIKAVYEIVNGKSRSKGVQAGGLRFMSRDLPQ